MKATALAMLISLGFLTITIRAVRRKQLQEFRAVLWLIVSSATVVLSVALPTRILDPVARAIGIGHTADLVWAISIVLLGLLFFELAVAETKSSVRVTRLVQEVGIIKEMIQSLVSDRQGRSTDDEEIIDSMGSDE